MQRARMVGRLHLEYCDHPTAIAAVSMSRATCTPPSVAVIGHSLSTRQSPTASVGRILHGDVLRDHRCEPGEIFREHLRCAVDPGPPVMGATTGISHCGHQPLIVAFVVAFVAGA